MSRNPSNDEMTSIADKNADELKALIQLKELSGSFMSACINGDTEKAREILAQVKQPDIRSGIISKEHILTVPIGNKTPAFPLSIAVYRGHIDVAKFLLANGANPNQAIGVSQVTPLHLALREEHSDDTKLQLTKLLLAKGANPNQARTDGSTPFFVAFQNYRNEPDNSNIAIAIMINLLNAIYESEEVGCNIIKFKDEFSKIPFSENVEDWKYAQELVEVISQSDDPLSAKVVSLMIQAYKDKLTKTPSPTPQDTSSKGEAKSLKSQGGSSRGGASNY